MWHSVLIALHASAGTVALIAGCASAGRGRFFGLYQWTLVAMAGLLVAATAVGWSEQTAAARVLFVVFDLLAGYLVYRSWQARVLRPAPGARPSGPYVDHLGFTLVALFDAFVVIAALDAGAPGWAVAAVGVAVAVAGHFVLRAARRRLTGPPRRAPVAG